MYLHSLPSTFRAALAIGFLLSLLAGTAAAQVDSVRVLPDTLLAASARPDTTRPDTTARHNSPRGALWRAAVLPGWGQIYNHHYYKLPVVYGGFAALVVNIVRVNNQYLLYRHAYQYRAWQDRVDAGTVPSNPAARYKPDYDRVAARFGAVTAQPLRNQRDIFRRSRDLSYLGVGLFYGLTVLDAYVSAQLLDFDVGENLSLALRPASNGPGLALRLHPNIP